MPDSDMCVKEAEGFLCCCPCNTESEQGPGEDQAAGEGTAAGHDNHEMSGTAAEVPHSTYEPTEDHNSSSEYEDTGVPPHWSPIKQLHSATGFNLAVSHEGEVFGTTVQYHELAVLEISAAGRGEVRIKGKAADLYVAMDEDGRIYAEEDSDSENTVWYEKYDRGWNSYLWKGNANQDWYLGIKKSGRMKKGEKTRRGQKAVRFVPREAYPPGNVAE